MKKPANLAVLPLISACVAGGGSDGGGDSVAIASSRAVAAEVSLGIVPSMVTVDYDEGANVLTLTDGATTRELAPLEVYNTPGFAGLFVYVVDDANYASRGETSSGRGRVIAVNSPNDGVGVSGAFLERIGDTMVPATGTAIYKGDYVSWLANASDLTASSLTGSLLVEGAATLNVNFTDSSVDGMITDRQHHLTSETLADILLVEGSIVDGQFSGTTTGGESSISGATVAPGEYIGLLTGANAEEAVGGVHITHTISGTDVIETGAFVVD